MSYYMGIDIGGTKIAGAVFDEGGKMLAEKKVLTPYEYPSFLDTCVEMVNDLEKSVSAKCSVGVGVAGAVDQKAGQMFTSSNLRFLISMPLRDNLATRLGREVKLANDASCAALAEAIDGAGAEYDMVLGCIMGTGVGSSIVFHRKLVEGPNGMTGEIGHLPLPFREPSDGPLHKCNCGQSDCIESSISGPALARLYTFMTNKNADAEQIAMLADQGDVDALRVLDRYYEVVAKAMVTVLHGFDPDIIVLSGGLSSMKGIYREVPKRWGKYACYSHPETKLVPAKHGPIAGVRGAAWLWRDDGASKKRQPVPGKNWFIFG